VQGGAGDVGAQAAAHDFQDVVEGERQAGAQFDGDRLFLGGKAGGQGVRRGRAIGHVMAVLPAPDGGLADTQFAGQRGGAGRALLDIGADARGRRGVGVQLQLHGAAFPCADPLRRRRSGKTLAPVGPQGPPARRAARPVAIAARARGSLLWTTGTSCAVPPSANRSCNHSTACHTEGLSHQCSGTQHLRRYDEEDHA